MVTLGEMKAAKAEQVSVLLEASRAIDATMHDIPVADIELTIDREAVEMYLEVKGERIGVMTPRALKNMSRLTRASVALMFNQSDPTLNSLVQRQLAELNSISVLHDPSAQSNIVSVFRKDTYQPYDKLLESVVGDIIRYEGDILESDSISFMTGVGELSDSIVFGAQFGVSANNMARSTFASGLFRLICENGAVNKVYQNATIKDISPTILMSLVREFDQKKAEYVSEMEGVLDFMRNTPLNQTTHWHLLDGAHLPKKLVERYKDTIRNPVTYCDVVKGAAAQGVETVYDSFNILTHLAKELPAASARARAETCAFSWATDLRAMAAA